MPIRMIQLCDLNLTAAGEGFVSQSIAILSGETCVLTAAVDAGYLAGFCPL